MMKRKKAELRIMKATTIAGASTLAPPSEAVARFDGSIMALKKSERTIKAVKWIFAVFQLETAAVQSVPTKIGRGDFTAFALILRMGMRGGGQTILILIVIVIQVRRSQSQQSGERRTWLAGPVRPSSTQFDQKINPKTPLYYEPQWKNRPVAGTGSGCGQIETGLQRRLVRIRPRRRGKPLRQRRVKPTSGFDTVSPTGI